MIKFFFRDDFLIFSLYLKLGGWDNNIYIYNLNYGNKIYSDQAHSDAISSLVFDSNNVISA